MGRYTKVFGAKFEMQMHFKLIIHCSVHSVLYVTLREAMILQVNKQRRLLDLSCQDLTAKRLTETFLFRYGQNGF